jgi:hypothetical protein
MMVRMPKRFTLPSPSRRQVSTAMVVLVMVLAVAYVTAVMNQTPPAQKPWAVALQSFRNDCAKAARHANGGGDLVMDDATEEKIGAYCGCMADAIESNVEPSEIEKIGRGQPSDKTVQLLSRIAEGCKPQLQ